MNRTHKSASVFLCPFIRLTYASINFDFNIRWTSNVEVKNEQLKKPTIKIATFVCSAVRSIRRIGSVFSTVIKSLGNNTANFPDKKKKETGRGAGRGEGGWIEKKKKEKLRKRRKADCLFSGVKKGREREKKEDDSKEDTKAISREDRSRPITDPKDTSNLWGDKIKSSRRRRRRSWEKQKKGRNSFVPLKENSTKHDFLLQNHFPCRRRGVRYTAVIPCTVLDRSSSFFFFFFLAAGRRDNAKRLTDS